VANIYNTTPTFNSKEDIDNEIKKVAPDSPLTGDMILKSANTYNVDPKLIFAIVKEDSSLGTKGLAVKTKNAGNVGNDDAGNLSYKKDWQDGIDAVAKWLANHKTTKSKPTETSTSASAQPQAPAPATATTSTKSTYRFTGSDGKTRVIDIDAKDETEFLKAHPKAQKK